MNIIKRKICLLITAVIMLIVTGCGNDKNKDTVLCDVNLGISEYENVDILGVTYELFSKGYASVVKIKNPEAVLKNDVEYNGKTYKIIAMGHVNTPDDGLHSSTGSVFGGYGSGIEAPEVLKVPEDVIFIGSGGLAYCTSKEIILPSNLKFISNGAFASCKNITSLDIPESVEKLFGTNTFMECTNLEKVTIPESTEILYCSQTYADCSSLKVAEVGGDRIMRLTFNNCDQLEEVTVRDGIMIVELWAFTNCPQLKRISFPDSVTKLPGGLFRGCEGVEELILPDKLTDVPKDLFTDQYGRVVDAPEGIVIKVNESLVDYVKSIFPNASVEVK